MPFCLSLPTRGLGGVASKFFSVVSQRATVLSFGVSAIGMSDMTTPISDDELAQGRLKAYQREDRDLFLDVGFFISWYAHIELVITKLLAFSTQSHDLEAFDILCRGMDARTKIERLRRSAKRHGGIGPNMNKRLTALEKNALSLRNKLVHSALTFSEDDGPRRYFMSSLSNMPWAELGMGPPKTTRKPEVVTSLELYRFGVWMSFLSQDLITVLPLALARKELEIANPKARLGEDGYPVLLGKAAPAAPDEPAQPEKD